MTGTGGRRVPYLNVRPFAESRMAVDVFRQAVADHAARQWECVVLNLAPPVIGADPVAIVPSWRDAWAAHEAELDAFRSVIRLQFWARWQREVIREAQQSDPVETFEDAVAVLLRRPPQGPEG